MTTSPGGPQRPDATPRVADLHAREPKAIQRALRVLEAVASIGPGATARQVSHVLNYPPATTYRLLNLLVQDAYLVRTPDLRGFALGQKVTALAGYVEPARPPQAARELLQELRAQVRAGVHLARYTHGHVSLVDADEFFPVPDADALTAHIAAVLGDALAAQGSAEPPDPGPAGRLIRGVEASCHLASVSTPIRDDSGEVVACLTLVAATPDRPPGERECSIVREYGQRLAPLLA